MIVRIESDRWGHEVRASQSLRYKFIKDLTLQNFEITSKNDIYDCACSNNYFLGLLSEKYSFNMYGSDIEIDALNEAVDKYKNASFVISRLPKLPFSQNKFDLIFALEVLYYLDPHDYSETILGLYSKLKAGGILIVSSPDSFSRQHNEKKMISDQISSSNISIIEYKIELAGAVIIDMNLIKILKIARKLGCLEVSHTTGFLDSQINIPSAFKWIARILITPILSIVIFLLGNKFFIRNFGLLINLFLKNRVSHSVFLIKKSN
jgi:hypothetical protein